MDNSIVSIAIPTYEMGGIGSVMLAKALDSIKNQTYKNIEIVISDHSENNQIELLCNLFKNELSIVYIKNLNNKGNFSNNLNNAIRNCSGKIIKFLMQDDFLYDNTCIEKIHNSFIDDSVQWLATGCKFGRDYNSIEKIHSMFPEFDDYMVKNMRNSIGSPSVVSIRNSNVEFFNEGLQWVTDMDYYVRLKNKFGNPLLLREYLVFVLQHENQISETLPQTEKDVEQTWLSETYK